MSKAGNRAYWLISVIQRHYNGARAAWAFCICGVKRKEMIVLISYILLSLALALSIKRLSARISNNILVRRVSVASLIVSMQITLKWREINCIMKIKRSWQAQSVKPYINNNIVACIMGGRCGGVKSICRGPGGFYRGSIEIINFVFCEKLARMRISHLYNGAYGAKARHHIGIRKRIMYYISINNNNNDI